MLPTSLHFSVPIFANPSTRRCCPRQGFLALVALLLVLWLPPLFFSSGAPTYQVPALQVRGGG